MLLPERGAKVTDYRMRRAQGLTLIELMVVLVVLAILAGIAFPLYENQIRKSRRTDGRAALSAIAMAEERFRTVTGAYTADLTDLSISPTLQGGDSEDGFYSLAVNATTVTFTATATATGGQANDTCTAMTITELGTEGGTGTGCW